MKSLTPLQLEVYHRALEILSRTNWFKDVYLDEFPEDLDILAHGVEECATWVYYEASYRDEPMGIWFEQGLEDYDGNPADRGTAF